MAEDGAFGRKFVQVWRDCLFHVVCTIQLWSQTAKKEKKTYCKFAYGKEELAGYNCGMDASSYSSMVIISTFRRAFDVAKMERKQMKRSMMFLVFMFLKNEIFFLFKRSKLFPRLAQCPASGSVLEARHVARVPKAEPFCNLFAWYIAAIARPVNYGT